MEAIILAGGYGTRLQPVVNEVPKPMAPIAGTPFLELLLKYISNYNFSRVIISLGYMYEKVISYFGDSFDGLELVYEVEDKPLGTGGAIRAGIERCLNDHVFVFNGDTFIELNLNRMMNLWVMNNQPIIVGKKMNKTSRYAQIEVFDGKVTGFKENHDGGLGIINAGCYLITKQQLKNYKVGEVFSFEKDHLPSYVENNAVDVFISEGYFIDIGIPEDYFYAQNTLKGFVK
jgi:D-glycero-alpha-D-manno-heptose 1-phosphate guanylyltransferase